MITALAHRIEQSDCHPDDLEADVIECLQHMPEMDDADVLVSHLHGLVQDYDGVVDLLGTLLPGARYSALPAIRGGGVFFAAVDATEGQGLPYTGVARTKARALLAATLRAYAARTDLPRRMPAPLQSSRFRILIGGSGRALQSKGA